MRTRFKWLASGAALYATALSPMGGSAAFAQSEDTRAVVCMVRMTTGSPRGDQPFYLILPASRVSSWVDRGFALVPCEGKDRNLPLVVERICTLAGRDDGVGEGAFREIYGVTAAEVCALARELEGGQ